MKRQPVPAGGAPTPATIEAADATPPAATTDTAATGADSGDAVNEADDDGEMVEARALIDFDGHTANAIVRASADAIERMKLAGQVDPHPDAVAFARALA